MNARKTAFTLIEVLIVIAVITTIISVGSSLFVDGWRATHRAIAQSEQEQLVMLLMKKWQAELCDTKPTEWKIENNVFIAGLHRISGDGKHLTFTNSRGTVKLLQPIGQGCTFSIERNHALADCAVINLNVKLFKHGEARNEQIRIISCGRKP